MEEYEKKRDKARLDGSGDNEIIESLKPPPTAKSKKETTPVADWPEWLIQKVVAQKLNKLGLCWWHTPNEGKRTPRQGKALRDAGLKSGVYDIIIASPSPNIEARGIALELKSKTGRESESQKEWGADIRKCGWYTKTLWGYQAVIQELIYLGFLENTELNNGS